MLLRRMISAIFLSSISIVSLATSPIESQQPTSVIPAVSPWRTFDFNDTQYDDLKAFGTAVGDARYVILGEKTHGEGNVFALKARLVRYLHEELGFEVLAIESGLYEGAKINSLRASGKRLQALAPGNIFFMYSGSQEVAPLFAYLDAQNLATRPMALTTFDSQHSGSLSLNSMLVDFADYLTRQQSDLPRTAAWRNFAGHCYSLIQLSRVVPSQDEQKRFFNMLDRIDQILHQDSKQSPDFPNGAGFWTQISTSLRSQAKAFWFPEAIPFYNAPREQAMANNLLWVLEKQHPNKKVVIWAHDFHGQKVPLQTDMKGMLNMVREVIPTEKFYHVYFTGYAGRFVNFANDVITTIPAPDPKSIETQLHTAQQTQVFVNLKGSSPEARRFANLGVNDYNTYFGKSGYFSQGKPTLGEYTDGVFYIDEITPSTKISTSK